MKLDPSVLEKHLGLFSGNQKTACGAAEKMHHKNRKLQLGIIKFIPGIH